MKKALLLLFALTVTAASFAASNPKPVEDVFQRYWSAFSNKDFTKAAAEILPADLDGTKAALLPVFLAAQSNQRKEVQDMVAAFFGRTVGKSRETMTPQEVFTGLNRLMVGSNPQLFDLLKSATTSIVFVRTLDADNAEVHFQVTFRGASDMDVEALTKTNSRWWIRVKDNPQDLAEQFKQLFTRSA